MKQPLKKTENYFINRSQNIILKNYTTKILEENKSLDFHRSLNNYHPTPIVSLKNLAKKYNINNIFIKDESFRFGLNAFKALGASYAVFQIIQKDNDIETFCTATDGNHGRALAWASKLFNKKCVVYVPQDTSENRIKAIENENAKVVKINANYDETCAFADEQSKKMGWILVQDTAWHNYEEIPAFIMAGYLTMFKEMEENLHLPNKAIPDIVFLQSGVGSFAGSAIWYYLNRYGKNRPKIVIVEPKESDGMLASFKAGKRVVPDCSYKTIMAGLNCGIPSLISWDIVKSGTDVSIRVDDEYAKYAMQDLYYSKNNDPKVIAGESGAGGLAGFIALMKNDEFNAIREELNITSSSNILCYNTEGATDIDSFNMVVSSQILK